MRKLAQVLGAAMLLLLSIQLAAAQDNSVNKTIQRFATRDVEAVARLDLANVNLPAMVGELSKFGMIDDEQVSMLQTGAKEVQGVIEKYRKAGVKSIFVFMRMTDLSYQGTTVVMSMENAQAANRLNERFQASRNGRTQDELFAELRPTNFNLNQFAAMGNYVVATSAEDQMAQAKQAPASRRDFGKAAIQNLNQSLGLIVFGSEDSRMAIKQIMPVLDPPFDGITGTLVADGLRWCGLSLSLNEKISLDLQLQSNESGPKVKAIVEKIIKALPDLPAMKSSGFPGLKGVVELLDIRESDDLVTVSSDRLFANPDEVRKAISPRIEAVRNMSRETTMMNNLRQSIIAMHNFESATKGFPVRTTLSENGKPLLSWRVQILPFTEQGELYKKFKLDEPWDSEHNRKLIPLMPKIYADVMPGGGPNNRAGKTIVQVPVGEGTMFEKLEPCKFGNITDGTSNTIAIVTVAQENAVIWTKPADWEIDAKDPRKGLIDGKRDSVLVCLGDGSVQRLPATVDPQVLLHLIQMADGNVVEWPRE